MGEFDSILSRCFPVGINIEATAEVQRLRCDHVLVQVEASRIISFTDNDLDDFRLSESEFLLDLSCSLVL